MVLIGKPCRFVRLYIVFECTKYFICRINRFTEGHRHTHNNNREMGVAGVAKHHSMEGHQESGREHQEERKRKTN